MKLSEEGKPVVVFEGELFEVTYVKQLLEENGIIVFLKNELMSSIAPWNLAAGGFNSLKITVSSLDYDEAVKIIESLDYNEAEEGA